MRGALPRVQSSYVKVNFSILLLASLAYVFLPQARAAPADEGQAIFAQKCKACHTIGGGRTVGPDLKGVTDRQDRGWLIRFIVSPDQVIAQGDSVAKQLVQEYGMPMPNVGLSQQEAEKVLAYVEAQSGGQTPSSPATGAGESAPAPAGDAKLGRELFTGGVRFANGAVACVSCHNVKGIGALGGGSVGRDLTAAYSNFGQDGLTSILQTTPFPVMREAYADHPLTETEIAHLSAFLKEASGEKRQAQEVSPLAFILVGLVGFVPIMGLFQLIWRGRLQGVRQSLVKGGSK